MESLATEVMHAKGSNSPATKDQQKMEERDPTQTQSPDTTGHDHEENLQHSPGARAQSTSGHTPPAFRRKRRVRGEKVCAVCGDQSMSHNFGALTCETCKAFFRRNAHRQKDIPKCVFENNCEINKATRRFCAACRLHKCFAVGMNADLILDEKEKKARRKQRRVEKGTTSDTQKATRQQQESATPCSPDPSAHNLLSSLSAAISRLHDVTANVAACGKAVLSPKRDVSTSGQSASCSPNPHTPDASTSYSQQAESRQPQETAGKPRREFQHVAREELPWDINLYWPLTEDERQSLTKLSSAYQDVMMPFPIEDQKEKQFFSTSETFTQDQVFCLLDIALRKCVRFSKLIPEFNNLRQADQITLLKASALQLAAIRGTAQFLPENRLWRSRYGEVRMLEALSLFGHHPFVSEFAQFCGALKLVVKNDNTLYALLHAIAVFDARPDKLEERLLVNRLRDRYMILLKHYLESEFSFLHADRYFAELTDSLVDLRLLGQQMIVFYMPYSNMFQPLLMEIFAQ